MSQTCNPKQYNSVSPYVIVNNAKELRRYDMPDGTVVHAELQIDSVISSLAVNTNKVLE